MRITVIGAGVIGLSCAHDLAEDGHEVTVVADHGPGDTVSALSAALWFPFAAEKSPTVDRILERSLARFAELAGQASDAEGAGADQVTDDIPPVEMRTGTVFERATPPDRSWVDPVVAVLGQDAVHPVDGGMETTLPMIMMPTYLAWLMDSCRIAGVRFRWEKVESLAALAGTADAVVVAGGLRGGELLGGDDEVTPIRGQVVVLANGYEADSEDSEDGGDSADPGVAPLTRWATDNDHPDGETYVLPRVDSVVVGGTADVGSWDEEPSAETAEAILARAAVLVPETATLPILGHGVGLRPGRTTLRVERVEPAPPPTAPGPGKA
ncbi:MAG: FAD-binding oxidoreductase, partial [Corynebacterium nuruki]|nr:FAD-binding oxidoreductase [Corynebacterium nuruki]